MKLFYRKYGNGPPLIILHGLYGSSDNWITIARLLADSFTVILPDQRNHGQSPHSSIHDYNSMRDDLHELTVDLSLKKFFLAGHSMGGKTAVAFALKWPEMLNGLLIADVSPFSAEYNKSDIFSQHSRILDAILSLDLRKITSRTIADNELRPGIPLESERNLILKNLQRISGDSFSWKLNPESLKNNIENIIRGIELERVYNQPITGFPVIFLKGGESEYIPESHIKDILRVFPAAEIIEIPGAGHWIHADKPEEVVKNMKKLLN